ncbi:MAG: hypothetical protein EOO73_32075 [Myxococcales bacterium]|nr:MAG: hypothetical protein EOO73_32075 [Myxococcales bacterium]
MSDAVTVSRNSTQRRVLRAATLLLLLSVTVLERFGLTAGAVSISAAMLAIYPFLGIAGLAGQLVLSLERTLLYGLCMAVALSSLLVNEESASFSSFALLGAMYLPFVFVLREGALAEDDASWIYARFLDVCLLCAAAGVAQFALQFVIHAHWLFDYSSYIPAPLRMNGIFNTVIPMGSLNKSNGFFFREPSGFSYLMALGLIAETVSSKRPWRVALMAGALLLTYSGTGILALLLASLYPFGVKTVLRLAGIVLAGALVFWLLGDALNLSFTLGRVNEFSSDSSQSSGYIRYVAPGRLVAETLVDAPFSAFIGHGPGTIFHTLRSYEFHDPTWAKLLFEYGAFGFLGFLSLFLLTLRRRSLPVQLRAALFWGWLVMGGHLLSPEQNFLTLVLVGLTPFGSSLAPARARTESAPAVAVSRAAWA